MILLRANITLDDGSVLEIDKRNLISIDGSIFDRGDLNLPDWGIISNRGNIAFNDSDGQILNLAENLRLTGGLTAKIVLYNTLNKNAAQNVATMVTEQWDYDERNKTVSVSLKDDLEEWQEINVDEIPYDPRKIEHKPLSWLYEHLWAITNTNYPMQSLRELDEETRYVLENTYIVYPLMKKGTLWQQWTKLCEVCQLHIYKDSNGVVVCRYNGGN